MSVWSGLGMGIFGTDPTTAFDEYCDTLIANGITTVRVDIPTYSDATWVARSKPCVVNAVAKGMNVIWGVSGGTSVAITSTNWAAADGFHAAILAAAQWAHENGVYEFQLGNEEELHVDGSTMTVAQIQANMKSTATEVQEIFIRGNVSYACNAGTAGDSGNFIRLWLNQGRGDIDIIAMNAYLGGTTFNNNWVLCICEALNGFGSAHFYISEFSLSFTSLNSYSTNAEVQTVEIASMVKKIRELGVTRAIFFCWNDYQGKWGVITSYGDSPALFWNSLSSNSGRRYFIV